MAGSKYPANDQKNPLVDLGPHERMSVFEALGYSQRQNLQSVIVVGYDEEGFLYIVSGANNEERLLSRETSTFLLQRANHHVMGFDE